MLLPLVIENDKLFKLISEVKSRSDLLNKHIVSVTRVYSKCDLSRIILLTLLLQLNYFDSSYIIYPVAHLQNNLLLVNQFEVATARGSGRQLF